MLTFVAALGAHAAVSRARAILLDNVQWTLSSGFAALALAVAWKRANGLQSRFLKWTCLGFCALFLGQCVFDVQASHGMYPIPDPAALPFLLRAPLAAIGFLVLLKERSKMLPALLDAAGFGLMILSLVFAAYQPLAEAVGLSTLVTLVAYPVGFFCLSALSFVCLLEQKERLGASVLMLACAPFVNGTLWTLWNARVLAEDIPVATLLGDSFSLVDLTWAWAAISWTPGKQSASERAGLNYHAVIVGLPVGLVLASSISLALALPSSAQVRGNVTACAIGAVVVAIVRQSMLLRQREQALLAEAEARRVKDLMLQGQKLEVLGTIASGVAHDLNNLLTVILANTDLIPLSQSAEESAEFLQDLRATSLRGKDTVQRILRFAHSTPPAFEQIELASVVREAQKLLTLGLPKTHVLSVDLASPLPNVYGNASQIHQILLNLAINASHAIGKNPGEIRLRTKLCSAESGLPARVELRIADTGCGMDSGTQARALEPFFTTKPQGVGTGLGLTIVRDIVQEHQGTLEIQSTVGVGTTVTIVLPVVAPA